MTCIPRSPPPPVPSVGEEEIARAIVCEAVDQVDGDMYVRIHNGRPVGGEHLVALIAKALAALPQHGWQDIASAPKNGTRILIYVPNDDDGEIYKVAEWGPSPHRTGWSYRGGWLAADEPEAWQPLTPPPAKEG